MKGRLGLLYHLVREASGRRLVDIGSDHATVPIELLKSGAISQVLVTDVRKAPLLVAQKRAKDERITRGFASQLTDGLQDVDLLNEDVVLISGMGGETIARVLENDLDKLHIPKRFILQPQSKEEVLRRTLAELSLNIREEHLIEDEDQLYLVMVCEKEDNTQLKGDPLDYFFGPRILQKLRNFENERHAIDPTYRLYIGRRLRRLMKASPYDPSSLELLEQFKDRFEADKFVSYNDGDQSLSQPDGRGAISKERR